MGTADRDINLLDYGSQDFRRASQGGRGFSQSLFVLCNEQDTINQCIPKYPTQRPPLSGSFFLHIYLYLPAHRGLCLLVYKHRSWFAVIAGDWHKLSLLLLILAASPLANSAETTETSPHGVASECRECHDPARGKAGKSTLRNKNINRLCDSCHEDKLAHELIHPVDLSIPAAMRKTMSADFAQTLKRNKGKTTCTLCHDVIPQCTKTPEIGASESLRGRNRPSGRTGLCYNCHDQRGYQRLNPHDQISENGVLNEKKCLVCHAKTPQQLKDGSVKNGALHPSLERERKELCLNCHRPPYHPGGSSKHLGSPTKAVVDFMEQSQPVYKLKMPREPGTGRLYCATCHNPHERGVIKNPLLAKGADDKYRLRKMEICQVCHNK